MRPPVRVVPIEHGLHGFHGSTRTCSLDYTRHNPNLFSVHPCHPCCILSNRTRIARISRIYTDGIPSVPIRVRFHPSSLPCPSVSSVSSVLDSLIEHGLHGFHGSTQMGFPSVPIRVRFPPNPLPCPSVSSVSSVFDSLIEHGLHGFHGLDSLQTTSRFHSRRGAPKLSTSPTRSPVARR